MGVGADGWGEAAGQAKVGDLYREPGAVYEDVLRLQVSVQHPVRMAELHPPHDLQHDVLQQQTAPSDVAHPWHTHSPSAEGLHKCKRSLPMHQCAPTIVQQA